LNLWCSLYDQIFKPSRLQGNADLHLFKAGIEPKWEDSQCANGGKWTVISNRKPDLDNMWLETVILSWKQLYLVFLINFHQVFKCHVAEQLTQVLLLSS